MENAATAYREPSLRYEEISGKYEEMCGKYEEICGKNEEEIPSSPPYRLWDLEKFRALPSV